MFVGYAGGDALRSRMTSSFEMIALQINILLLYAFLAFICIIASPNTSIHSSTLELIEELLRKRPDLNNTPPTCFTIEHPPFPGSKLVQPTADDCIEVSDGYREEDTRREEPKKVSFGETRYWPKDSVDFQTPMAKTYHSCYGGLVVANQHSGKKVWEYMRTVADEFVYLQWYCSTRGNLGGGVQSTEGLAWLIYGVMGGFDLSQSIDASIMEHLFPTNMTVVRNHDITS